jgi:hypothetical protein
VAKVRKFFDSIELFAGDHILRMRIWEVPDPMYPSEHRFKYSLFYGVSGVREVLYDNERGKDDHRHYGDYEEG